MSGAFTAKNYPIHKAPKLIELIGDKTKRTEPAQHVIEFPGGAIEVSRTSDCNYWAHIIVNQEEAREEGSLRQQAKGGVVYSSLLHGGTAEVSSIEGADRLTQVAVLIQPKEGSMKATRRRSAPGLHVIAFPGGAVEISKTADRGYEVDILITGNVVGSRIMREGDFGVYDIEEEARLTQISAVVKPLVAEKSATRAVPKAKAA